MVRRILCQSTFDSVNGLISNFYHFMWCFHGLNSFCQRALKLFAVEFLLGNDKPKCLCFDGFQDHFKSKNEFELVKNCLGQSKY